MGNTICRAFGSVQQDTCPFHLFVTFFYVFILHLFWLFLTSSWLSAVPLHSHFFLLSCLKEGVPLWLDFPESTELLFLPCIAWTRSWNSTYTGDTTSSPQGVSSHLCLWRWNELEGGSQSCLEGSGWLQWGDSQLVLNTDKH